MGATRQVRLETALSRRWLRAAAGDASFARGEEYFAEERVRGVVAVTESDSIAATVRGSRDYRVRLWRDAAGLAAACTCPMGESGAFCKHAVAVGLAWLERVRGGATARGARRADPLATLRATLSKLDAKALADLLAEVAAEDDELRERLLLRAAERARGPFDPDVFRRAIRQAVRTGGGVPYREAADYARRVSELVEALRRLPALGHAAETVELAELFLTALEERIGEVDDSDGYLGQILGDLEELHLAACRAARPEPRELARRLFRVALGSEFGAFGGAGLAYQDVLGTEGLAAYRAEAEAAWAKVRPLGPGERDARDDSERFRIARIMESLARASGDVEELAAVLSRDLSHAGAFLEIADLYAEAGQRDRALEWAERGLAAFPDGDSRLRDFLAAEYLRRGRSGEALALVWANFADLPDLPRYQSLKTYAERAGAWPAWRERALGFIREGIAKARRESEGRWHWGRRADHSTLVEIFLHERDIEAAWREAQAGGCGDELWLRLAAAREREHPADALAAYERQVERALERKNARAYEEAVALVRKVRQMLARLGRASEFGDYLARVGAAHRRKRNFIRLLDAMR